MFKILPRILASLIIFAGAARADVFTLLPGGINDGHFGVGPLNGTLQIGNSAPFNLTVFCVDFNHEVNFGQSWDVSVTPTQSLMGIYGPPHSTPGGISAETFYREEVVLTYTLFLGVSNNQTIIDIQHAVWNLSKPGSFTDAAAIGWGVYAADHIHDQVFNTAFHNSTIISQLTYISDPGGEIHIGPGQEMITFNHIPEPSTYACFAIGLLSLVGLNRLRRT